MAYIKRIGVRVKNEHYVTHINTVETISSVLNRIEETHGIPVDQQHLYILDDKPEGIQRDEMADDVMINFIHDFHIQKQSWLSIVYARMDALIMHLRPVVKALVERKNVLDYVKNSLSKCLGARVFCTGASVNNIFLPDEQLEVTPFLCKGQEEKWFLKVNEGLCSDAMSNGGFDDNIRVSSVTFNCKKGSVLATVNAHTVQIVHNDLSALYNGALLEDINHMYGQNSMIKKSILLIKSWCRYDSCSFSPGNKSLCPDLLSPDALHVMIFHLFYRYGHVITHPLHALVVFIQYYAHLRWDDVVVSIGPTLSASDLSPISEESVLLCGPLSWSSSDSSENDMQLRMSSLISSYRQRYQHTVEASKRAKDDEMTETTPTSSTVASDAPTDNISERENDTERPSTSSNIADAVQEGAQVQTEIPWGMSSSCPSLTTEFRYSDGDDTPHPNICATFQRSHINIADTLRPTLNLTTDISPADVEHISSILRSMFRHISSLTRRCKDIPLEKYGSLDAGMGVEVDIGKFFLSEGMSYTHDLAMQQQRTSAETDQTASIDELRRSKYFCESENPESVLRHAELIMGSKITADAVANLIVHIVEQAGPHPIGEIGKLLQESTGNPNLSRVLKSQFRGLKKLIEGYPHMLKLGGDHSFNPHVYLADKGSIVRVNSQESVQESPSVSTNDSEPQTRRVSSGSASGPKLLSPAWSGNTFSQIDGYYVNKAPLPPPGYGIQTAPRSDGTETYRSSDGTRRLVSPRQDHSGGHVNGTAVPAFGEVSSCSSMNRATRPSYLDKLPSERDSMERYYHTRYSCERVVPSPSAVHHLHTTSGEYVSPRGSSYGHMNNGAFVSPRSTGAPSWAVSPTHASASYAPSGYGGYGRETYEYSDAPTRIPRGYAGPSGSREISSHTLPSQFFTSSREPPPSRGYSGPPVDSSTHIATRDRGSRDERKHFIFPDHSFARNDHYSTRIMGTSNRDPRCDSHKMKLDNMASDENYSNIDRHGFPPHDQEVTIGVGKDNVSDSRLLPFFLRDT